ncbi:MAG: NAD(P)-binding protein [Dehalococcoidales bacterium]
MDKRVEGEKVGAVLVVGGGVGGIQSALDLAESGYKVYLVEDSPAIGGVMAQLDKTLPTNDCSMCILSPKLVECGRHLNIDLLTYSEVLGVRGNPGNFIVSIKKKARFVDGAKCTGCGVCADGCPIIMPSEFDEGLGTRKAIYTPYLQAVPRTYAIDKREERPCHAACKDACPIHMNVQGYMALTAEGMFKEAYDLIRNTNPLPAICGRVCYAPCEDACNRGQLDEPVASRALKRFIADQVDIENYEIPQITKNGKKVAIIGSGPAGLAAAHDLALHGYEVTIFEALPEPGGMLRYGIPAYRLPKDILAREIGYIEKLGVGIKTNVAVGKEIRLEQLKQDYQAIFIASGAHQSLKLGIPGEDSAGVVHAVEFLRKVNMGEKVDVDKRVAVIGGGNAAMDASRVARRLGAEVKVIYRRSRSEMPASDEEVRAAEEEGIDIMFLTNPTRVIAEGGRVTRLECIKMKLREPDDSGRRRPVPIKGSEFFIEVNTVIPALGQVPDIKYAREAGLKVTGRGTITVNEATLATDIDGIFAGGDVVTGPAMVIEAIAAGKKAALSIDAYLKGEPLTSKDDTQAPQELSKDEIVALKKRFPAKNRVKGKELKPERRIKGFKEVEQVYSVAAARREARRCLASQIEGCFECRECEERCEANAINHEMQDEYMDINVGSIIMSPGLDEYEPSSLNNYGYSKYPNVVTSIMFERMLSASGPFKGELVRPLDRKPIQKIAWIQCVGSRDEIINAGYCSSVCCTYAIKQAIIAKEHAGHEVDTTIFFMDMRTFGKGYEQYYHRAEQEYKVRFVRSRVFNIEEVKDTGNLLFRFAEEDGTLKNEEFDLAVLSVGFQPSVKGVKLAERLGIDLNKYQFCQTGEFSPVETSRPGIFVAGVFQAPKDIPETVMQASAAAANSSALLSSARHTLTVEKEYPPEKDISKEPPRIGVFVCHCGINIGGYVNVPEVKEYAATLPNVVFVDRNLYTCSQDTQEKIKEKIKEYNLNRVVVASCTPRTHEPLFQETIREAGLNRFLFEMANIRDQCSWVHMREPKKATEKAKELVRMAVARVALLEPLHKVTLGLSHDALVIGGGVAGMIAALNLAEQGFKTYLVEREKELGGWTRKIHLSLNGEKPQDFLESLIKRVEANQQIEVLTNTVVVKADGFVGNFKTTLASENGQKQRLIEHGVIIVASGAREYRGSEYLLGQHEKVLTLSDFEEKLVGSPQAITSAKDIAMILCARPPGKNYEYCSRVCCTVAIKNALKIKEINPGANIYILYKDVRTYGFKEELYTEARKKGIVFIRYTDDRRPQVTSSNGNLGVITFDPILGEEVILSPDFLVLATPMVPSEGNEELSKILKVPLTEEGFFHEAHVKLAPVDFASEGIYLCGTAHSPKFIDETIAQAQAAAGRATTILSKQQLEVGGAVCQVDEEKCKACLTCVRVCPYDVPYINEDGVAIIEVAKCRGCGVCAAECPREAIQLLNYKKEQVIVKSRALLTPIG